MGDSLNMAKMNKNLKSVSMFGGCVKHGLCVVNCNVFIS